MNLIGRKIRNERIRTASRSFFNLRPIQYIIFITQKLGATAKKNGFHIRILHQKIRSMHKRKKGRFLWLKSLIIPLFVLYCENRFIFVEEIYLSKSSRSHL